MERFPETCKQKVWGTNFAGDRSSMRNSQYSITMAGLVWDLLYTIEEDHLKSKFQHGKYRPKIVVKHRIAELGRTQPRHSYA